MRAQLEIIEKIDAYILGELSPSDAQAFAFEIQQSAELQEIYATQKLIQQAILRKAILFQVQQFAPTISPATTFWTKFKWPIILSSILIALLGLAAIKYFSQDSSEKIGSTENNLQSVVPTPKNNPEVFADSIECLDATTISPFKPITPSSTTTIAKTNNRLDGLKTWINPEIQTFSIDPKRSNTLECIEGTLIIVPANAIVDKNGNKVKESVQLEVVEALTIDKMIAYNLTTTSGNQSLTSGGMLYIQPYSNGEKVSFAKDTPCHIEVPTDDFNGEMKAWKGKVTAAGNIEWENPVEIKNYLIPVDFSTLDFVPAGFRPHFQSQLPFENYPKSTVALEDSFYYSLSGVVDNKSHETDKVVAEIPIAIKSKANNELKIPSETGGLKIIDFNNFDYQNNKVQFVSKKESQFITINERGFGQFESKSDKPMTGNISLKTKNCDSLIIPNVTLQKYKVATISTTDGECIQRKKVEQAICYINPASVKALRQAKFRNTFIATPEFEERLQLLHTIKNAESLLALYVQHIDKNMWEVDSMVAMKVTGQKKIIFKELASQKLTNVDLKNANLDAIQEYYNSTRKQFQADARSAQEKLNQTSKAELDRLANELTQLQTRYFANYQQSLPDGAMPISKSILPKNFTIKPPKKNVAQQTSYKIPWNGEGWMNIDNYIHILSKGEKVIPVIVNTIDNELRIYQCINSLKTVIGLNKVDDNYAGHYPSAKNPENIRFNSTYCVGIQRIGSNIQYAASIFNANTAKSINLEWEKVSDEELLENLKALSPYNNELAQSIIDKQKAVATAKEFQTKQAIILEKRNEVLQKQLKHEQFVQGLIDFIDPCMEKNVDVQPSIEIIEKNKKKN